LVLITETSFDTKFATYSFDPSGVSAHPNGSVPTRMTFVVLIVVALITETVPPTMLVTYTFLPSGVIAIARGSAPTLISRTFWLRSPTTLKTDTELLSRFTAQTNWSSGEMTIGLERVGLTLATPPRAFAKGGAPAQGQITNEITMTTCF